jgi:glycosyltransferase involved in cell wall biosynthesis
MKVRKAVTLSAVRRRRTKSKRELGRFTIHNLPFLRFTIYCSLLFMKFSIIIPTYNEQAYIERCLQSIVQQRYNRQEFEIIVSDAQSTDKTVTIAQKYTNKIVTTPQRGIAHGRNLGARQASGDILLFVDADVTLQDDFLLELEKAFGSENVAAVSGKAIPVDGGWFPRFVYHATYALVRILSGVGLPLFPGLCVAYSRKTFFGVEGFREDFGITEDLDLSRRISRYGTCLYQTRARAFVSTRRLQHHALSTVLFHIYHDIRYLFTGKSAVSYPKSEEVKNASDLWRMNRKAKERRQ